MMTGLWKASALPEEPEEEEARVMMGLVGGAAPSGSRSFFGGGGNMNRYICECEDEDERIYNA